ncbi:MAG: hypothetical protein HQ553_03940 [Chloroflexi bacterium]|nr:hypothetical protein [Chloroflexota bacterium]
MIGKLAWLIKRAKNIKESEKGLLSLPRRILSYILLPVFWRKTLYLYEHAIENRNGLCEDDYRPAIDAFVFKIVTSHNEAEKLEAEGFMFRSYPTFDNTKLKYYWKLLDEGAIAFCGFYEKDLATIQWILPNQEAIHRISPYRQKVNFSAGETYTQGSWSNIKYRGTRLHKYNVLFNRDPYLLDKGIKIVRNTVWDQNKARHRSLVSVGAKIYAKAHLTKVLWWKFWEREITLSSAEQQKLNPPI